MRHQSWLHRLSQQGYQLRLKQTKLVMANDGKQVKKGNCDVDIAVDIMSALDSFRTLVLLSGDGDMASLCQHCLDKGKRVVVLAFSNQLSRELLNMQVKGLLIVIIDEYRTKLELTDNGDQENRGTEPAAESPAIDPLA